MIKIQEQINLAQFTTFNIGGPAKYFIEVFNKEEIKEALQWAKDNKEPILILGGGSNMLLADNGFVGLAIKNSLKGIVDIQEVGDEILIQSGSGEKWDDLVEYSLIREYWGLENLTYIPGTVGASPVQNIGAYGVEVKDVFDSLEAINIETLEEKIFKAGDCDFGYRSSAFKKVLKGQYLITSVTFRLSKLSNPRLDYGALKDELDKDISKLTPRDIAIAVKAARQSKLPETDEWGSSGSFFQNPIISVEQITALQKQYPDIKSYPAGEGLVKMPAGWLIDQAGWKGKNLGPAGVWDKQALVLVNKGGAKSEDIKKLAQTIQKDIKEKFGIDLMPEVNIFNE